MYMLNRVHMYMLNRGTEIFKCEELLATFPTTETKREGELRVDELSILRLHSFF